MTIGDEQVSSDEATNPGQHDLLLARLEGWMRDHIDGFRGPLAAEQFEGGQSNPTYKLLSGAGSYVLRRKPLGHLLPSAHAVEREYRVMRALAGTAVPVPKVFALCEDDTVIGSAFYVMEFLGGCIFWDPRLPGLAPAVRRAMFASMNSAIAALHSVDHRAVGLAEFGRPGNSLSTAVFSSAFGVLAAYGFSRFRFRLRIGARSRATDASPSPWHASSLVPVMGRR
jgi:aminoglycoside phosphotransferase (APT) family kinase protein